MLYYKQTQPAPDKYLESSVLAQSSYNKVISLYEPKTTKNIEDIKILGFAYCTKAQAYFAEGNVDDAVKFFEQALALYETANLTHQYDQYARAMNVYAGYLARQEHPCKNPKEIFDSLEKNYWEKETGTERNLYAGRFYFSYATFLKDSGQFSEALGKYQKALAILIKTANPNFIAATQKEIGFVKEKIASLKAPHSPRFHQPAAPAPQSTAPVKKGLTAH